MSDNAASRSRRLALAVLCTGGLMVVLDSIIVTVALPAIQADLGFTPSGLTWTINTYMIAFGGLLLLGGRLGDLLGRRRVLIAGLTLFTASSVLCGLATTPAMLIAARFFQGAGGALASAVSLGMIVALFTDPVERGRAIGAFAFTSAAGASIGQVLGGVLTDVLSWQWNFLINLPIGLAAIVLGLRALEPDRGLGLRGGTDALGAVLATAGAMTLVYAIIGAEAAGWTAPRTLAVGAVSLLLLAGFAVRQATAAVPLLPPRVLRSRNVTGANLVQLLAVGAMFAFQVHIALYMQQVLGYGATMTGLAMLPAAVVIGALSLGLSARLNARFGERAMLLAGLVLLLAARVLLTRIEADGSYVPDILVPMLLTGGFGLVLPALTGLGMSGARQDDAGVVSGLFNTTQQIGGALGVAVLSTLAASRTEDLAGDGAGRAEALTGGFRLGFEVGGGMLLASIVLALLVLRQPRPGAGLPDAPPAGRPASEPSHSPAASENA